MNDPHNPTDDAPSEIEANLGDEGQFRANENGEITCLTCRVTFPVDGQSTDEAVRLEGASDPDDLLLILPVRCPACGTAGSMSLGYGPQSAIEDGEVVRNLAPRQ